VFGRVNAAGTAAWLLTDKLGSVRDVTDGNGVLKDTIVYDGYGNVVSQTDATWTGRYQYTSREFDASTGLQYNRGRYYDAATGRWISQDPLGFDAGDSNRYRYAHNGYTDATDPSGLKINDNAINLRERLKGGLITG
jgi:RHS repeat-associated protein